MTTAPSRPTFSDPELQKTLEHVAPRIDTFQASLDALSEDIKSLEKYLDASSVRMEFARIFDGSSVITDEPEDVMGNYSGGIHQDSESVEWAADKTSGRWRLLYKRERAHGELELCENIAICGPTFNGPTEVLELKPLIETPLTVRLRARKVLPMLLEDVAVAFPMEPLKVPGSRL
jgi:hypothetical protein